MTFRQSKGCLLFFIMDFEEYLAQKKIAVEAFRAGDKARFEEWALLFQQMHPDSFTAQKKFLINDIRRLYHADTSNAD